MNNNNNKVWNKNGYNKNEMNEKNCNDKSCNKNASQSGAQNRNEPKQANEHSKEKCSGGSCGPKR